MHKICFTISLFHACTCFEHHVLIFRMSKIVLYSLCYHDTYMWPSHAPVQGTATYRCGDTRGCIIQFKPPDDELMVLETCRGMK